MTDPFLAEINIWPGNYAPEGWNYCNGAILNANQNPALFALLGNVYGGTPGTTFALPDLRARVVVGSTVMGQPNWTGNLYPMAATGGVETVTLAAAQSGMPAHTHVATNQTSGGGSVAVSGITITGSGTLAVNGTGNGSTNTPSAANVPAVVPPVSVSGLGHAVNAYGTADTATKWTVSVNATATGGSVNIPDPVVNTTIGNVAAANAQAGHENRQPYIALAYVIALQGTWPPHP